MSELKKYIQGDNNGLDYVLVGDYYIPALEVTEELKACEQMHWVRRMNGIRNRAEEIVLAELIYTI